MIHLMLHRTGLVTRHLILMSCTVGVPSGQLDALRADHVAGVVRYRQATLPAQLEAVPLGYLRVYQYQVAVVRHRLAGGGAIDDDDPLQMPHLGCGDPNRRRTVAPGLLEIIDKATQTVVEAFDRCGGFFQPRIRQLQYFENGHWFNQSRFRWARH